MNNVSRRTVRRTQKGPRIETVGPSPWISVSAPTLLEELSDEQRAQLERAGELVVTVGDTASTSGEERREYRVDPAYGSVASPRESDEHEVGS